MESIAKQRDTKEKLGSVIINYVYVFSSIILADMRLDKNLQAYYIQPLNAAMYAAQVDADCELASEFLIYSMLFSAFTMFLFLFLLKTWGWPVGWIHNILR